MRPFRSHWRWRWREPILATALVIAGVAGFAGVRGAGDAAARQQAEHRAELVGLQVEGSAARATAYVGAIRGYVVSHRTISEAQFSSFTLGILGVADLNQVAWVQPVGEAGRRRYEAAIGRPITQSRGGRLVPAAARPLYYPATLITQVLSGNVRGVDLGGIPELRSVLGSSESLFSVVATAPVAPPGSGGVFFVEAAPRPQRRGNAPGFVVVFVPADWLEGSLARAPGALAIRVGGGSVGSLPYGGEVTTRSFTAAAQRWSVLVSREPRSATSSALAWSLLAGGLALAASASTFHPLDSTTVPGSERAAERC
jgi:hypothetical protein